MTKLLKHQTGDFVVDLFAEETSPEHRFAQLYKYRKLKYRALLSLLKEKAHECEKSHQSRE